MSYIQSRSDRNEGARYRKTGRCGSYGQQRGTAGRGGSSKGVGGGDQGPPTGTLPTSSPVSSSAPNQSLKKSINNAQGAHGLGLNSASSNASRVLPSVQNASHAQPPVHGTPDAPAAGPSAMHGDSLNHSCTQSNPNTSSPNVSVSTTDNKASTASAKVVSDGEFSFQFGSISPGLVNVMQFPARTSSAPPNLDEQKHDEVHKPCYKASRDAPPLPIPSSRDAPPLPIPSRDAPPLPIPSSRDAPPLQIPSSKDAQLLPIPSRDAPPFPIPSSRDAPPLQIPSSKDVPPLLIPPVPKQQALTKDAGVFKQSSSGLADSLPKAKRDTQFLSSSTATQAPKSSAHPMSGISMQMPIHHPPTASVQFGGSSSQIQPPAITIPTSIPFTSAPQAQQQPMFVSSLQQHPFRAHGFMTHGQSMGFATQMGSGPQLGSLGFSIPPPYPQQGATRRSVKITDPKTNEELRLETYVDGGSVGLRSHSNLSQVQTIPPYLPGQQYNYYNNSYQPGLFSPASSLPTTSSQVAAPTSQALRFNYPANRASQAISCIKVSAVHTLPTNKAVNPTSGISGSLNMSPSVFPFAPSPTVRVTVKPAVSSGGKVNSAPSISSPAVKRDIVCKPPNTIGDDGLGNPQKDSENNSESSHHESFAPISLSSASGTVHTSISTSVKTRSSNTASFASEVLPEKPLANNADVIRQEPLIMSNSINDHRVGKLPNSSSSLSSQSLEPDVSMKNEISESMEAKTTLAPTKASEMVLEVGESGGNHPAIVTDATESDCKSYKASGGGNTDGTVGTVSPHKHDDFAPDGHLKSFSARTAEHTGDQLLEEPKHENNGLVYSDSVSSNSLDISKQIRKDSALEIVDISNRVNSLETVQVEMKKPVSCQNDGDISKQIKDSDTEVAHIGNRVNSLETAQVEMKKPVSCQNDGNLETNLAVPTSASADLISTEADPSNIVPSTIPDADRKASFYTSLSRINTASTEADVDVKCSMPEEELSTVLDATYSEATLKHEVESTENISSAQAPFSVSDFNDKPAPELNGSKSSNTEAILTTSDIKGQEDKKGTAIPLENVEVSSSCELLSADVALEDPSVIEAELEDGTAEDGHSVMPKKYSRDILLKFYSRCTTLPNNFDVELDVMGLMAADVDHSYHADHESFPGLVRNVDRTLGGSRLDRRGSSVVGAFVSGREVRQDIGYGASAGFRTGQSNHGVLRNPQVKTPTPHVGGILSSSMQSLGPQGGMQRISSDSDRWKPAPGVQKGLLVPPQTQIHKAERRYEIGKVTDEEQAKQRQLKAILNKLTPQNFEKLFEQVKAVNIDNAKTLTGIISQIFDKALMEPTFCEMYADFCSHLAGELPDFSQKDKKISFRTLLLNKCQEEFERGEKEQEETNEAEEGEIPLTKAEREQKRIKVRRRMLGNIRLIGELYKKRMLTDRIMHFCIQKLLSQDHTPEEEDIEALCKLMSTIGVMFDNPRSKDFMDSYFFRMTGLSDNKELSSRVRFMLKDSIDLRKNNWQQRRKVEGPKKIEEVHRDAVQERQAQVSRSSRGPSFNPSGGRPADFGSRGSTMAPSQNARLGGYRGLPRGFGTQDARPNDRHPLELRVLSVPPLSRRSNDDDSITLGPQGGLARGMSVRGQPSKLSTPASDPSPSSGDSRRATSSQSDQNNIHINRGYNMKEDRHDKLDAKDCNVPVSIGDKKRPDRNVPVSGKVWPEEQLRAMSIAAIREYYSAKDEKEVALCIKDLNSPSFYPTMISIWVTDSFERKDMERDLLARLLVNLTKPQAGTLNHQQLLDGFEAVLTTLEDAVNDAPRAAEFLGCIFTRAVLESVVSLGEVGGLAHEGGEEPGSLRQVGLAAEIIGTILERIKAEKGDAELNSILRASNLKLEDFRHPDPKRSTKLQLFI